MHAQPAFHRFLGLTPVARIPRTAADFSFVVTSMLE
jgi:hypothetical protein